MLETEEVDEGYFTPNSSTSLANIFKRNSSNHDAADNATLKYKPLTDLQVRKSKPRPEEANATQCIFSCSLIAYEWVQDSHKCKGKIGFAILQNPKTSFCTIVLYKSDKSTISSTTITPQLEVTLKGAMISLYDDYKKYWGLCFYQQNIDQVIEILQHEEVIIKHYNASTSNESVPLNPTEMDNLYYDLKIEEPDSIIQDATTSRKTKASILSRIANVGQSILPTSHILDNASPPSTLSQALRSSPTDLMISSELNKELCAIAEDTTKNAAIQVDKSNFNIKVSSNLQAVENIKTEQTLVNNQLFTYMNGCMMPVHIPVFKNIDSGLNADITRLVMEKLDYISDMVKSLGPTYNNVHKQSQFANIDEYDATTSKVTENDNDFNLCTIRKLELQIKQKDEELVKLQNEIDKQITLNKELIMKQMDKNKIHNKEIDEVIHKLELKNEEIQSMVPKGEINIVVANKLKTLMNDIFRSLISSFETASEYPGSYIKNIIAKVVKKNTIGLLSAIMTEQGKQSHQSSAETTVA